MLQDASSLLYLRTAKIGTWSERPHRKEGQKKELVATVVQLERTKSRETLFSSYGKDKHMFLLVIATGSRSSTLQYGRLFKSKRNENQSIKFSSERTC